MNSQDNKKMIDKNISQEQLQSLMSNIPGIVYRCACDKSWTMQYMSDFAEKIIGYPASDFINNSVRTYESIIHHDDARMVEKTVMDAVNRKVPYEIEYRIITADGTIRWVYEKGRGVCNGDNKVLWLDGVIFDITERKQIEGELKASREKYEILLKKNIAQKRVEEELEEQILTLIQPLEKIDNIMFKDLFNMEDIQRLQDEFSKATGVASIITEIDGTPITAPSNFCQLCKDVIRKTEKGLKNCIKSDAAIGRFCPDGPIVQTCLSGGLWDAGAGITVGGKHVANWLIGQVRDETQTKDSMVRYAQEIGADEQTFLDAFLKVPSMSREQFGNIAQMLFTLSSQLSNIAYKNIQQKCFIDELKLSDESLRKSEGRFCAMSEATSDVIITSNADGIIIDCNKAISKMFGYEPHEVLGQPSFVLMTSNKAAQAKRAHEEYVKTGNLDILGKPFESIARKKDGTEFPIELVFSCWKIEEEIFFSAIIRDVTDRKLVEEKLHQSQKMEAIGTLAGGIAHDFNNILSAVIGYAELAVDEISEDSTVKNYLEEILKSAIRAKDLVKQILKFSRKSHEERRPILVYPIVKEVAKLIRSTTPASIEIRQDVDETTGMVNADPVQIHQIVMNLCTNAAHAMRGTGGILDIALSTVMKAEESKSVYNNVSPGSFIELKISDTGSGMDPKTIQRIFEPFFTTKDKGEGTGMGLAVIHGIIIEYGGDIVVDTEPGEGSTFTVLLPQVIADPENKEDINDTAKGGTECILFVDDEKPILDTGKKILQSLGYTVISCNSSPEAFEIFEQQPDKFDLVITDQSMPSMSGYDLAKRMLEIKPTLPVILCTGYSDTVTSEKAVEAGIKAFIHKPIRKKEIARIIREALGDHNLE